MVNIKRMKTIHLYFHGKVFQPGLTPPAKMIEHHFSGKLSLCEAINLYELVSNVKISLNGELVTELDRLLEDGDELQFFRPVSGG